MMRALSKVSSARFVRRVLFSSQARHAEAAVAGNRFPKAVERVDQLLEEAARRDQGMNWGAAPEKETAELEEIVDAMGSWAMQELEAKNGKKVKELLKPRIELVQKSWMRNQTAMGVKTAALWIRLLGEILEDPERVEAGVELVLQIMTRNGMSLELEILSAIIESFYRVSDFERAERVFDILNAKFETLEVDQKHSKLVEDVIARMLLICRQREDPELAKKISTFVLNPNIPHINPNIYSGIVFFSKNVDVCISVLRRIQNLGIRPSSQLLSFVLECCAHEENYPLAYKTINDKKELGFSILPQDLVNFFRACRDPRSGSAAEGILREAMHVESNISEVISSHAYISLGRNHKPKKAMDLFFQLRSSGQSISGLSYIAVIAACCNRRRFRDAIKLLTTAYDMNLCLTNINPLLFKSEREALKTACQSLKPHMVLFETLKALGAQSSDVLFCLVAHYCLLRRNSEDAIELLSMLSSTRFNWLAPYEIIMDVFAELGRTKECISVLEMVKKRNMNEVSYNMYHSIIKSCQKNNCIDSAFAYINELVQAGMELTEPIYRSLIFGFVESKRFSEAILTYKVLLSNVPLSQCQTCTELSFALIQANLFEEAQLILDETASRGIKLNSSARCNYVLSLILAHKLDDAVSYLNSFGNSKDKPSMKIIRKMLTKMGREDLSDQLMRHLVHPYVYSLKPTLPEHRRKLSRTVF